MQEEKHVVFLHNVRDCPVLTKIECAGRLPFVTFH